MLRPTAVSARSKTEEAQQSRVCAGAPFVGDLRPRRGALAIDNAQRLGSINFDAVRHLPLCRIERTPPRLDIENYPHPPLALALMALWYA